MNETYIYFRHGLFFGGASTTFAATTHTDSLQSVDMHTAYIVMISSIECGKHDD